MFLWHGWEHREEKAARIELVQSISASGYIDYEPLLVVKENDGYVVLEGNRRLGAVRLLRSPALQAELKVQLPQLSPALKASTDAPRVLEMASRADARAFIGFKHINGPHKADVGRTREGSSACERMGRHGNEGTRFLCVTQTAVRPTLPYRLRFH